MTNNAQPVCLAFCITDLDPGGAERALVQLVTRLDRTRWQPHVFCLSSPGALVEELSKADVPVICLGAQHAWQVWILGRLVRQLRRLKPKLLQTFLFHGNLLGRLAGRLAGVKHIVSGVRVAEQRSRVPLWLDRITNSLVEHNVCVSQSVADFSVRHGGLAADKISVITNGVDADRFANAEPADLAEFAIPPTSKTVIAVGRLDPQKGPTFLIDAAEQLIPKHDDLHVLFVGAGPLDEELRRTVRDRNLADRIHFAGWRPDVAALLKAAYCLALPSLWEGMPNVALEAMAAGLPVVASRVEGTGELIDNGKTGLLVAPSSAAEFQSALNQLLCDVDAAKSIGRAAQTSVRQHHDIDAKVAEYERLYLSLLASQTKE